MSLGPVGRLSFFGFLCPCHESDDEYLARTATRTLQGKKIAWFRSTSQSISLQYATLHLLDRSWGPTLQLISNNAPSRRSDDDDNEEKADWELFQSSVGTKLCVEIPLYRIDRVECCTDDGGAQLIQCYVYLDDGEKSKPILQLSCGDVKDTIQHLTAVLSWDRIRRADIDGSFEHWEASTPHINEEKAQLLAD